MISEMATSDLVLAVVGALVGTVWTWLRSSEWMQARKAARWQRALDLLEAGVDETYRSYVQALKQSRVDRTLTPEEKKRARAIAKERAFHLARTQGVNLAREIGEPMLDLWITRTVNRVKSLRKGNGSR